jgi:hypothetical protein
VETTALVTCGAGPRWPSFVQREGSDGGAAMTARMSDLSVREQRSLGAV